MRAQVAADIRSVFNSADRPSAGRRLNEPVAAYATSSPKLAAWLEANLTECFTVFAFPAAHQRRLRTSDTLERVNQELKRRTRVAAIFPSDCAPPGSQASIKAPQLRDPAPTYCRESHV